MWMNLLLVCWRSGCHSENPVTSLHKSQQPEQSTVSTLPQGLMGLSLSWPAAVQVLGSFDPACPFPSLTARAGSVWVRCQSCKERRKKTHRFLLYCASFGSAVALQHWSQGGKLHECINSLLSHQIPSFMGLFSFQISTLSQFWRFPISFAAWLHFSGCAFLVFFLFHGTYLEENSAK